MKKWLLGILVVGLMCVGAAKTHSQTEEFQTLLISGTADIIIDSTLTSALMKGKRLYINGIYAYCDNGASTGPINIQIIRGQTALIVAGSQRQFLYQEALVSGVNKALTFVPNLTTGPDSTIYFVVSGTTTDSLFLAVNYKIIGK